METILGYIAAIAIVILTICIYIYWTNRETVITFSQEGRNNYIVRRAGFSFLLAGIIVAPIYWLCLKIVQVAVVVLKWGIIFGVIVTITLLVTGLLSKNKTSIEV